jgi:hypothetical protein
VNIDEQFNEVFGRDDRQESRAYALDEAEARLKIFRLLHKAKRGMCTDNDAELAREGLKFFGILE